MHYLEWWHRVLAIGAALAVSLLFQVVFPSTQDWQVLVLWVGLSLLAGWLVRAWEVRRLVGALQRHDPDVQATIMGSLDVALRLEIEPEVVAERPARPDGFGEVFGSTHRSRAMNGVAFWLTASVALMLLAALILGGEPVGAQAAVLWLLAFATSVGAAVLRRRGRWLGIALRVSDSGMMEVQGDEHIRRVGWDELAYLRVRPLFRTVEVGLQVPGAPIHIPFETGSVYRLIAIILARGRFGAPRNAA